MRVGHEYDTPAASAVAAVRSAGGDLFLTVERYRAVSAVPGAYRYRYFINKHFIIPISSIRIIVL